MEEDHKDQLKAAEERRTQALEELTRVYESRLEETSQHLTEVAQEEQISLTAISSPAP